MLVLMFVMIMLAMFSCLKLIPTQKCGLIGSSGSQGQMYVILYNLAPVRRIDLRRFGLRRRGLGILRAAGRIRHRSAPREVKRKAIYVKGASRELRGLRGNGARLEIATSAECAVGAESRDRMRIRCAGKLKKN